MTDLTPARRDHIVRASRSTGQPLDVSAAFVQVVDAYSEMKRVREQETTRRREIESDERVQLAQILAKQQQFLTFLDKSFDEQAENFRVLFQRMDMAQQRGDVAGMGLLLEGIVDIAKTSPFADLLDVKNVQAMLANPDHHYRL